MLPPPSSDAGCRSNQRLVEPTISCVCNRDENVFCSILCAKTNCWCEFHSASDGEVKINSSYAVIFRTRPRAGMGIER